MRKVLLATTALVALGGVSAASADVTISGAYEFKYSTWSDNTASTTTNNTSYADSTTVSIDFSETLDNGMSTSLSVFSNGTTNGAFNGLGATLSGDFGTIGFGTSESGDAFATAADVTPEEGNSISVSDTTAYDGTNDIVLPADEHIPSATISYLSPNMNGFQFSLGVAEQSAYDDATMMGVQYSTAAAGGTVTLKYATSSTGSTTSSRSDEVDAASAGLVLAMGDATLTVADNKVAYGTTTDYSASSAGISYVVSDSLTLSAYTGKTEDAKQASYKLSDTGVGAVYTVAPGLTIGVTHNSWDFEGEGTNEDGDHLAIALGMSF
jgi:hypothetical protein